MCPKITEIKGEKTRETVKVSLEMKKKKTKDKEESQDAGKHTGSGDKSQALKSLQGTV